MPKVVDEPTAKPSPALEALIAEVQQVVDAKEVADNAEPVVITDDSGKEVRHLNLKLSAVETMRIMALPPEDRAVMATHILKERRLAAFIKKVKTKDEQAHTRKRKAERRRKNKNKRRSR